MSSECPQNPAVVIKEKRIAIPSGIKLTVYFQGGFRIADVPCTYRISPF